MPYYLIGFFGAIAVVLAFEHIVSHKETGRR